MKKIVWATSVTILFLVVFVPGILALAIDLVPAADQPGYRIEEKRGIYGKFSVSQPFISQQKNLTAIGISLGNPNLKNKKSVILSLFEGDSLVRTSVLNGQNLEDGGFVKFIFPLIPDSKDKEYMFTISSPDAGTEEIINVFFTENVPDWIGKVKYQDEDFPGGLPFVTFHKPESKWLVVKDIYSNWLTRLLLPGFRRI